MRKQCKYSLTNACKQLKYRINNFRKKNKELQNEQNKQFADKTEPKLGTYFHDENYKTFLMMKMFLVSDFHHQAKNIVWCLLKKRNYVNLNV